MKYHRWLEGSLRAPASRGKARLVLGARQTGKSTLFGLLRGKGDLLLDLQDRSERQRLARDPGALSRAVAPPTARGRRHVLIDEVQRVPELLDEIQSLLDRHPGRYTFTLTGSSARRLRRGKANLLPGRVHRFLLGPVTLWEQAGGPGTVLPSRRRAASGCFPRRRLEEMLVLGCLPAAFTEGGAFRRTLESYAETYIEEEVLREMAARNLGDYGRFLELAALESGKTVNLTKISRESGIALTTIRGFYSVLEDTLLGFSLRPFSGSGRVRLMKTPRFYFFDVGVRNAVARLPLEPWLLKTEAGPLFEHWVAGELSSRIAGLGRSYRLSTWRTVDGAEVDFILETPREAIPLEVKYTANPRPADARGVEHFLDRYPSRARRGFVICRAPRAEQLTRRVRAVPWEEI